MSEIMLTSVLDFWFKEIDQKQWWVKDAAFDELIKTRFSRVHQCANAGELYTWRTSAKGRLAEIIILDQFSRNMFRGKAASFLSDSLALVLAQEAVALNIDSELAEQERAFLYMPFMHSESRLIHEFAEPLFKNNTNESSYRFELRHKDIIDRFGRYPHRNSILGRESSPEELAFLEQPGSAF